MSGHALGPHLSSDPHVRLEGWSRVPPHSQQDQSCQAYRQGRGKRRAPGPHMIENCLRALEAVITFVP